MSQPTMTETNLHSLDPDAPFFLVRNVTKTFGALRALDDLSFEVNEHEMFGIVGPNGAGKSTLLNVCTGALKPNDGDIKFNHKSIVGMAPYNMCKLGIARTFQIPQVFGSLSIRENIETAAMFGPHAARLDVSVPEIVESVLERTDLSSRASQGAGQAELITRKMIMLGAVLATQPRIVFMDEPLAGLNGEEIQIFIELVQRVHRELSITFVIVEHKIKALTQLSDRLMVVHFGHNICVDTPEVVLSDRQVIDVYLGKEFDA